MHGARVTRRTNDAVLATAVADDISHAFAHLLQGAAGHALHIADLSQGPFRRGSDQPPRFLVSLISACLGGLKQVNDNRGHAEGDRHLRRVAEALGASLRGKAGSAPMGAAIGVAGANETDVDRQVDDRRYMEKRRRHGRQTGIE